MSTPKQYYTQPTTLSNNTGNNAFSFDQRKQLGSECVLHIPQILEVSSPEQIHLGTNIVFEEVDHKGNLHTCSGLQALYFLKNMKIPTYVMDNHNHALYLRSLAYHEKHIRAGATLIHIDQHADMGTPTTLPAKDSSLSEIALYTNEICNVGNFIIPSQSLGLVQDNIQIRSVSKLLDIGEDTLKDNNTSIDISLPNFKETGLILDIDIDFWSDHSPTPEELQVLSFLYKQADICTIALSPYFIDIQQALHATKTILKKLG